MTVDLVLDVPETTKLDDLYCNMDYSTLSFATGPSEPLEPVKVIAHETIQNRLSIEKL